MDGPSRSGGFRQSRRSRSQRDRERRRRRADLTEHRPSSPSSASDQELCRGDSLLGASGAECRPGFPGARHRPPRRRKRESVSCEEDIIDGFAIASFISLEALEMDCSLKPPERSGLLTDRGIKRKRPLDENGGPPATYTNSWEPRRKIKSKQQRKREAKIAVNHMETGYICDTESESGDKASDIMEPAFIICTREVVNFNSSSSTAANGCPLLLANRTQPLLSVTPRVSGLERSQERSMEQPYPESISATSSLPNLEGHSVASVSLEHRNGTSGRHHHHDSSPLQHKHKPFLGKSQSIFSLNGNSSRTSGKPSSSSSSSSIKPPTPATSVSLARGPGGIGTVRPSSRPSPGAVFTPSPSLPPPPRLVQVSPHPSTGGPSVSSSNSGTSSRSSQGQASIPPMAYQFHQHNHQHQHTHTHQHFLHPTAAPPPLFEKYPGKMEGLFRHPFFPSYPSSVPGIPPVLPPNGPFSSLQGAFQPKGAAPEMTAGLGVVPPHLQPKASRLTDPFAPPPKVSNKPGKWCAMHVRVAWLILRHQDKVKLLQADPQKLDFRNDLLPRLPGPGIGGLGGLGPLGGPLPPNHDLSRPGLFAAAGGVNPSSTPFMPPSTPHSSFLSPAAHLDPYVRSPPFSSLGALGSGAFGGLGSPTIAPSVFGHKTEPSGSAVGGLGNPHDPWNRLHGAPASFPSGSSWAKGPEKRDDRGKDMERREVTHIKDEKDRDSHSYGRPSVRISPGALSLKNRSGTPSSHMNGLISLSGGGVPSDSQSRERERERDSDKRQHSASKSSASSTAPDRPRSSTSSILTTSPGVPVASSPLDLFHRQQAHTLSTDSNHSTQRENNASSSSLIPVKKPDRTTTPLQSKSSHGIPPGLLIPPVKVKEERKEEPDPVPISLHPVVPPHGFERPSSRHPHHPSTPSSTLSLTPTPAMPLPPPTPHAPHHALSLLDRTRAMDAYLVGAGASAGLVLGAPPDRFPPHPHAPQGHAQPTHSFPWDPWRDLAAHHHQQQQQQRREILTLRADPHLALRSDPHLSRLLQHQRYLEAERAAVVAAVANGPHHPPVPTSTPSASSAANRPEFGLMSHPFDEEHRAQILREDYERARYFGMHPHLSAPHLPSPSHAAHLEQLHAGLLSHPHLHPTGASSQPPHHPGLFSRLGPLHAHSHMPNGLLTKAPGLVGALSVGAPPPLIPSVNRSSTPPRGPRLGAAGDLSIFSAHKDSESR